MTLLRGTTVFTSLRPPSYTSPRSRAQSFVVSADSSGRRRGGDREGENNRRRSMSNKGKSQKGQSYEREKRRRGRPAHLRSPDDTPLRDGNRDRLMGLLTERAARTLLFYLMELNPTVFGWFSAYIQYHKIPREGNWDDVSGETFIRTLLLMPIEGASWGDRIGLDPMYDSTKPMGVNPREIAQRILEIRSQIAKEWIEELKLVSEENSLLMRETLFTSLSMDGLPVVDPESIPKGGFVHPEMRELDTTPDDSAGDGGYGDD